MISKFAIQKFLQRKLDDHDWMKNLSDRKLDALLSEVIPPPYFHTKPRAHQKVVFLLCTMYPEFLPLLGLGLGKTKIILDLIYHGLFCGDINRTLVLVPNLANIESWAEQCETHQPNLRLARLVGTTEMRQRILENTEANIFVINYDGLVLCSTYTDKGLDPKTRKMKTIRFLDREFLDQIGGRFDCIVLDESHKVKNHQSWRYKVCNYLRSHVKVCYAMTGTPVGRDPSALWPQCNIVDRGQTFGDTLTLFRAAFFRTSVNYWGGYEHKFLEPMKPILMRMLKHRSISYTEEECDDLPDLVYTPVIVPMPTEIRRYYTKAVDGLIQAKGNYHKVKNIFMTLRQLSSGFAMFTDDDDEEKVRERIEFDSNPKLDALLDIVEAMPGDRKMVVFHDFIRTGEVIEAALKEMKIGCGRLWSGTKDRAALLSKFNKDPKMVVLICNTASGAAGINLQVANYQVFFESPVSAIDRAQAEKRCHRMGQTRTVFLYDLIMRPGIDDKIVGFGREGKNLIDSLMGGMITKKDIMEDRA